MRKLLFPILVVVVIGGAALYMSKTKQVNAPTEKNNSAMVETKEFTMKAYFDPAIKKPVFSLPEIAVKKGDKVKVKITNTLGIHDFVIDEFKVAAELPLNKEVIVEFVADKAGEFVYYCSKPGHRQNGQWGTLKVTE